MSEEPVCAVCDKPFSPAEWDDRHDLHEPGCTREGCACDMPCHAKCCPDCKQERGRGRK